MQGLSAATGLIFPCTGNACAPESVSCTYFSPWRFNILLRERLVMHVTLGDASAELKQQSKRDTSAHM